MSGWTRQMNYWKISLFYQLAMGKLSVLAYHTYIYAQLMVACVKGWNYYRQLKYPWSQKLKYYYFKEGDLSLGNMDCAGAWLLAILLCIFCPVPVNETCLNASWTSMSIMPLLCASNTKKTCFLCSYVLLCELFFPSRSADSFLKCSVQSLVWLETLNPFWLQNSVVLPTLLLRVGNPQFSRRS